MHGQRLSSFSELAVFPEKFAAKLICDVGTVDRQMHGIDLVVGVDFSKTNYDALPISNVVAKCGIRPNTAVDSRKSTMSP